MIWVQEVIQNKWQISAGQKRINKVVIQDIIVELPRRLDSDKWRMISVE